MTDTASCKVGKEFLFFTPKLRLLSELESTMDGAERSVLCAVARKLIARPPIRPSAMQLAQACFDTEARLCRAQMLLHDAEAVTAAGRVAAVHDAWELVDAEWRFVQDAPRIQEILREWARQAGADNPAETAQTVLSSISSELLPLLHLKWYLRATTPAMKAVQEAFLERWRYFDKLTPAAARLYSLWSFGLPAAREASTRAQLARCESLLSDPELELELKRIVAERYGDLGESQCRMRSNNLDWLGQQLQVVEKIEQANEPMQSLLALRAQLHQTYGIGILNAHFCIEGPGIQICGNPGPIQARTGIMHLAHALALDPEDKVSVLYLAKIGEIYRVLEAVRQKAEGDWDAVEVLEELCRDLSEGGREAEKFLRSGEAEVLRARRAAATLRTGPPRMHDTLRRRFMDPQGDAPAPALPGPSAARTRLYAWAFSARQPLLKAAAALGLLLLLHAATFGVYQRHQARVRDQNYQALLFSAKAGQADRAIAYAESFLSRTDAGDPRLSQVLDIYHRAVLHRLFALSQGGQPEQAKPLLKRHDALLARFQPRPQNRKEN